MKGYASSMTALLTSVLLVLAGCGLDSSGNQTSEGGMGGSGSGPGDVAEGGIGGSGSGTTTGYGSIYINDYRYYQIAEDAIVRLDGELITPTTINGTGQGLPLGMVVDFLLDDTADAELTRGTVIEMEANHRVIGPITELNPLKVLGQIVRINDATVLDNVDPTSLSLGSLLKVAGLEDQNGTLRASRLASATDTGHWQLVGRVSHVSAGGFKVGNQDVDLGSVSPVMECDGPLSNGQSVLLRATPQHSFVADDALTGVTLIRCLDEGIRLFGREVPDTLPATTDGFITDVLLFDENGRPLSIKLGGQVVDLSEVLPVLIGTLASLQVGSRLEVDGVLDTRTGVLQARRVRLKDEIALLEIIAQVVALDDGVITLLGQPVVGLPQTVGTVYDSLVVGDTVKLIGFMSGNSLYAVSAITVSPQPVSVKALVTSVTNGGDTLHLAGIPFPKESADSMLLHTVDTVVDLLTDPVCVLLPLLCPEPSEPPNLVGTLATLTNSGFTGSTLYGGDLILWIPAD